MKISKTLSLLALLFVVVGAAAQKPLRFAIASDFHAPDVPDGLERLDAFVRAANDQNVDFIIELGDFCRLDSASQPLRDKWQEFPRDRYHVLGNHDLDQYTYQEYVAGMKMPGRYYSFDKGDFHFIVLDANNLFDGKKYTHYARANYYVDAKQREFVDPEQMAWLKADLEATDKKCVLFSHQSIEQGINNGAQVRQILEDENASAGYKKVVMAFGGHDHSNYTRQINGITYMQINSASYVWVGTPTQTEKRYPEAVNRKYGLLKYSMTYDRPLHAIVTLDKRGAKVQGTRAEFVPPTPRELNMSDTLRLLPLVSEIADARIKF